MAEASRLTVATAALAVGLDPELTDRGPLSTDEGGAALVLLHGVQYFQVLPLEPPLSNTGRAHLNGNRGGSANVSTPTPRSACQQDRGADESRVTAQQSGQLLRAASPAEPCRWLAAFAVGMHVHSPWLLVFPAAAVHPRGPGDVGLDQASAVAVVTPVLHALGCVAEGREAGEATRWGAK